MLRFAVFALATLLAANVFAEDSFTEVIAPFTKNYCAECHNQKESHGDLDLTRYATAKSVIEHYRHWNHVAEFIRGGEMPPEDAKQPPLSERERVVTAIEEILLSEARKHAGDPGRVLPRRLSNTEYDQSVRDLTGVDIRPTADFPADPAAGEGFDNTGEALGMSPNLLTKYLTAADEVSRHMVLMPGGIRFAPFPVASYNERKKLTEQAIIDFYHQHDVNLRQYLETAWRYRYRSKESAKLSVQQWAKREGVSPSYLALLWDTLNEAASSAGYLREVGRQWNDLPPPGDDRQADESLRALEQMISFAQGQLFERNQSLIRPNAGTWPIGQLAMRAEKARERDQFDASRLQSELFVRFDKIRPPRNDREPSQITLYLRIDPAFDAQTDTFVILDQPLLSRGGNLPRNEKDWEKNEVVTLRSFLEKVAPKAASQLKFGKHPGGQPIDQDSIALRVPAVLEIPFSEEMLRRLGEKHLLFNCRLDAETGRGNPVHLQFSTGKPLTDPRGNNTQLLAFADRFTVAEVAAHETFCATFPNEFVYVHDQRGLAAGFHLVEGFFRDDLPLVSKVLDDNQRAELDQLWEELDFVTASTENLLRGFVWFERAERHVLHDDRFDFLRSEDPKLVEAEMLDRFEKLYLEKMGVKLADDSLEPESPSDKYDMIHGFFQRVRQGLQHQSESMRLAEQRGLADLDHLASRAFRRPLASDDSESLRRLYQTLRGQGHNVETSLRGVMTAILMSPEFCYRYRNAPSRGDEIQPLTDRELASRLSYLVWSSIPDDELLGIAHDGKLSNEKVLREQTRRMLSDAKVEAFAREFLGQWLRYRDYLSNDSIVADAFDSYQQPLREAMFEEPTRLATELIRTDQPLTRLLDSDVTYVNGVLAKHYGGKIATEYEQRRQEWSEAQRRGEYPPSIDSREVWHRVEGIREAGRGGLFGMGVILAKNSAGERTSPVKRGFWVVHHLLGKHFPPPPAEVPELPPGEKQATKTIRELLAEHTVHTKCALCHVHFDSVGLALEGFDPIGRLRTRDLAGREIDARATLPGDHDVEGIAGLIDYVKKQRHEEFVRTLCRKFLGYALGRSVILSDEPLLRDMELALAENDYRFSVLFETVVLSPQFRNRR